MYVYILAVSCVCVCMSDLAVLFSCEVHFCLSDSAASLSVRAFYSSCVYVFQSDSVSCVYVCLTLLRAVYQSDWLSFQPCVCPSDLAVCQAVWVCACPCVSYLTFLWTVCMSSCLSVWSCSGLVVCPRVRSLNLLNKKKLFVVCDFFFLLPVS